MSKLSTEILNAYVLPGRASDARVGLMQAQEGERIGLGGIVLSERWDTKELGAVMGALTQVTSRVKLVAGITHFGTRHPLVQAGMSATLQTLSGGRFVLGFGRSFPPLFRKMGIPVLNNAGMADYVGILRQLWAGKTVSYDGPAGTFPEMQLPQACENPPPVILGAVGPRTLALAGAHFDGVVLHPFLTTEGVSRSIAIVREGAERAGRDPDGITVYSIVVAAPDTLSPEERSNVLEARAVSYFMHHEIGLPIVEMNGWDHEPIDRIVATGLSRLEFGHADVAESRRLLAEAASLIPEHWFANGAAIGTVEQCAARLRDYHAVGTDQILLHGTTPDQQGALVAAFGSLRQN